MINTVLKPKTADAAVPTPHAAAQVSVQLPPPAKDLPPPAVLQPLGHAAWNPVPLATIPRDGRDAVPRSREA